MTNDQSAPAKPSLFSIIAARSRPALFKMVKGEEEFYFDSTDLSEHNKQEFEEMVANGWKVEENTDLPAYLPFRLRALEEAGLVKSGWRCKKR